MHFAGKIRDFVKADEVRKCRVHVNTYSAEHFRIKFADTVRIDHSLFQHVWNVMINTTREIKGYTGFLFNF
jgi:hypothetical protein